ncbi:DUF4145 domain-containing protein [Zavarzinella formosa]|uniref:DUF4145 domain-containing protein n=1 Tax=Zavarzinella formosa TaxID=360055 RepID=UPI00031243CE|nr:DUF4145 domain-containing protein [Zavarzinella formosa]
MHLSLEDFCEIVIGLKKTNAEKALALLWYHDHKSPDACMSSGGLAKIMVDHHVGTPNSTQLADAIQQTKLANKSKSGFVLKPGSRKLIQGWLPENIEGMQPVMNHAEGYLPEAVWIKTRGYIEAVSKQLNGCFRAGYYDAALVMLRRLFETLIIEVYEHLGRKDEIEAGGGNVHMLAGLVDRATGKQPHKGINIGRNTKNALEAVKALGDRSAHDRRFNACAADLTKIQIDARSGVQDLIQLGALKHS